MRDRSFGLGGVYAVRLGLGIWRDHGRSGFGFDVDSDGGFVDDDEGSSGRGGGWGGGSGGSLGGLGLVRGRAGLGGESWGDGGGWDFWSGCSVLGFAGFVALDGFLLEEAEHVVEDEVAVGLLGEEEALDELAPGAVLVGHFTDDQDGDAAVEGRLRVHGVDEDLAVLEAQGGDFGVDFLWWRQGRR